MPREESVAKGRSHCTKCSKLIPWYYNIPVFSFLVLRGRCAYCKSAISFQYPLVELLTGTSYGILFWYFGLTPQFFVYVILVSSLLVITFIDLEHQIIPDELSISGIVLGFLACFVTHDITWWQSLLGILLGGGSFYAVASLYEKLSGKEGLGGGDIKLLGMLGAWLGYESILPIVVVSSLTGSVIGLTYMALTKKNMKAAIPFGPFLALGAIVYLFFKDQMTHILFYQY